MVCPGGLGARGISVPAGAEWLKMIAGARFVQGPGSGVEKPDHRHRRLLRPRRERPRSRAAEQRDERAALYIRVHSTTSSARPSSVSGTVRPNALAVLRLTISSTLVDCWTGRSPARSPLRIRPA